jgi:hypothetical protein
MVRLICHNWLITHARIVIIAGGLSKSVFLYRVTTWTESNWSNYQIRIVETFWHARSLLKPSPTPPSGPTPFSQQMLARASFP